MRRACFAAVIAVWYLLAPPMYESYSQNHKLISVRAYSRTPLTAWTKFGSYKTLAKCEAQKHINFDDSIKAGPGKDQWSKALWQSSKAAICVSSDDPRLKK